MKPYGRNEAIGLKTVCEDYPDAGDLRFLGKEGRAKTAIRKLHKKVARQNSRTEIRKEVESSYKE